MSFELSPEQERARTAVLSWYRNPNRVKPYFFLAGFAGTGKSSVTIKIVESIKGKILFAAPTGKAALIMQQKGCVGAQTIHSLIYRPKGTGGDRARIEALQTELLKASGDVARTKSLSDQLTKMMEGVKPLFQLNPDSPLRDANLLVVDELSMIPDYVMVDLLSFNVPILAQGDLGQLPPVGAKNLFKDIPPDFSLNEIHRQARDSPVIYLATLARQGKSLPIGRHGESLVTRDKEEVDALGHEQIIVGTHKIRNGTNNKCRQQLGFTDPMPMKGDRVLCKRNNNELGLLNGDQFFVDSFESISKNLGLLRIRNETFSTQVTAHKEYFEGLEPQPWDISKAQVFSYAYSTTCHASQGSQYDSVFVFDESRRFPEPARWKYTAVSRAVTRVTVLSR